MHFFKPATLVLIILSLCACGGSGGRNHGEHANTKPPAKEEFGDVVSRLIRQQNNTGDPEHINPATWSYRVNENEAAFSHLF